MKETETIKKPFYIFLVIILLNFISGCDEDIDRQPQPPKVLYVMSGWGLPTRRLEKFVLNEGDSIMGNVSITVVFSEKMADVDITVSGVEGTTTVAGEKAIWTPRKSISLGQHTLTITGVDTFGQELEEFTPFNFRAEVHDDIFCPWLVGDECKPKNGDIAVDPRDYPEKLTLTFDKELLKAKVVATEPVFPFTLEIRNSNARDLEIRFLDYTMPMNTKFTITIRVWSLAGNQAQFPYSFTTITEEE